MGLFDKFKQKNQATEYNKDMQQAALAIYTCILTNCNEEDKLHCCKIFNAIDLIVLPLIEVCKKVPDNKFYDALIATENQQEKDTFISLCCSFQSFLQDKIARKTFTNILLSWGYLESEINIMISDAVHNIVLNEDEPKTPFPFTIEEQDMALRTWIRVIAEGNVSKITNADNLSQEQKYAIFGFAISLCNPLYVPEDRDCVFRVLANLAVALDFDPISLEDAFIHQTFSDRKKYIKEITTIKDDSILMYLTYTCQAILEWASPHFAEFSFMIKLFQKIGYTFDESIAITRGEKVHKYNLGESSNSKQGNANSKIDNSFIESWPLLEFAKSHGKMQVGTFHNEELNIYYKACIFTQNGVRTYVSFSSDLGELTPQEIIKRKNQLKIAKLSNGDYILYE